MAVQTDASQASTTTSDAAVKAVQPGQHVGSYCLAAGVHDYHHPSSAAVHQPNHPAADCTIWSCSVICSNSALAHNHTTCL
jgi:hypothetical protein